jgi:hypothetical protein
VETMEWDGTAVTSELAVCKQPALDKGPPNRSTTVKNAPGDAY